MDDLTWFEGLEVRTVEVGGHTLAYRAVGEGPPILFVHGWPLWSATYRASARQLQDRYRCLLPDLPGAGRSPAMSRPRELFRAGTDLMAGFLDALGIQRVGLVGQDSGAAIARLVAARDPSRVGAIVMANTELTHFVPPAVRLMKRLVALPGSTTVMRGLLHLRPFVRSSYGFRGCFLDLTKLDGEFDRAFIAPLRRDPGPALDVLRHSDVVGVGDLLEVAHPRLTMPVHCVWGAQDPYFPVSRLRAMLAEETPDWPEPVVIDDARLLVHEEHAGRFVEVCRDAFDASLSVAAASGPRRAQA
ncbi:MAG: alpha/beta fold hydrolase [Sandaracinaceae bacterium]